MKGQQIGYIRVSSVDQNTSRQLDGILVDKTFIDKCSGKDTNRPQLKGFCRKVEKSVLML
jgi:DNA invertase Pin-like site-specific DNA recombinase